MLNKSLSLKLSGAIQLIHLRLRSVVTNIVFFCVKRWEYYSSSCFCKLGIYFVDSLLEKKNFHFNFPLSSIHSINDFWGAFPMQEPCTSKCFVKFMILRDVLQVLRGYGHQRVRIQRADIAGSQTVALG